MYHTFICEKVPLAFIYNIDESGFNDIVDMRNEIIVVPVNSKRTTIIAGIALYGTKLTLCIALANKRCEKKLKINGNENQNVLLINQENCFINTKIVSYWIRMFSYGIIKMVFVMHRFLLTREMKGGKAEDYFATIPNGIGYIEGFDVNVSTIVFDGNTE